MVSPLLDGENLIVLSFSIIGFLTLSKKCLKFMKWAWSMFIRPPKKLTNYGSWALITGSTDGIGKAIAFEIASKGLNLILVGRNLHKLQLTSNEIWQKHGKEMIQIKTIVIDFAVISGDEIEERIRKEIQGLDVGILVNNVGTDASKSLRYFNEVDLEAIEKIIRVNVGGINWVTRAVLPGMLKKKKGAIVNIGSASSVVDPPPFPLVAVYASTKAYIAMLSRSMSAEYQKSGIDIQCQAPMVVATKMVPAEIPSVIAAGASAEQYSGASARWIGYDFMCNPLWIHAFQVFLLKALPLPHIFFNWASLKYALFTRNKAINQVQ